MRGSVKWQVGQILTQSGVLQIGSSKHQAKQEARLHGAQTWHDLGKNLGIYSFNTAEAYKNVWRQVLSHAKNLTGDQRTNDIEKLNAGHVRSFLSGKIEQGVAHATFQQYAAACEKLGSALNLYSAKFQRGNSYDFKDAFVSRNAAAERLERFDASRAYSSPQSLIQNLKDSAHRLAASIQLQGGARIHEVASLKEKCMLGENRLLIEQGKGGKSREISVSESVYRELAEYLRQNERLNFDKNAYRADLKQAAEATRQEYNGSHGLRWNYAQDRVRDLQENHGKGFEQAAGLVSHEMGHNRLDITTHYLK